MTEWEDTSDKFWSTSPLLSPRAALHDTEISIKNKDEHVHILSSDEEIFDQKGNHVSKSNLNKQKKKRENIPNSDQEIRGSDNQKKRKLTQQQIAIIAEYDDYDLDDAIEKILRPSKKQTVKTYKESTIPTTAECPICSRSFQKADIVEHASSCTGSDESTNPKETLKKNTIASSVKSHQSKHRSGHILVGSVNYYAESEDLLASDGTGLNEEITGLSWESRGQTRFS